MPRMSRRGPPPTASCSEVCPVASKVQTFEPVMQELHPFKRRSSALFGRRDMILGRFTLAIFVMTAPAVWAQYSRSDMEKLSADRFDTAAKTLKLNPNQAAAIRP